MSINTGAKMIASIAITLLVALAVLLMLLNVLLTQMYTARTPSGADAVGLVVPLIGTLAASAGFLLATWICLGRGGFAWIGLSTGATVALATLAALGVSLAAGGALLAWMERMGAWVPLAGFVFGTIGPIAFGALLMMGAWTPGDWLAGSPTPRLIGIFVVIVAASGLAMGAYGGVRQIKMSADNARRRYESDNAREAEWARRRARTSIEALREDFAAYSPDAPLWTVIASLPDRPEPECRALIVERALRVPNLNDDLARTVTHAHPRYRHGCLDFIRFAPAEAISLQWAPSIAQAILLTAEQIEQQPQWLTPEYFSNPHPAAHIRAAVEATAKLGNPPHAVAALRKLKVALAAAPAGTDQAAALEAMRELPE